MWKMSMRFSDNVSEKTKKLLFRYKLFFVFIFLVLIPSESYMIFVKYIPGIIITAVGILICAIAYAITLRVFHKGQMYKVYTCSTSVLSKGYRANKSSGDGEFNYMIYVTVYKNYEEINCTVKIDRLLYEALNIGDSVEILRIGDDYDNMSVAK